MENEIHEKLGELNGKLSQFMDNYNSDMERINCVLEKNEMYLRTEVRKALNGQVDIKTRLTILELESKLNKEITKTLSSKLEEMTNITEKTRFFSRNPDVEKGNKIYGVIKFMGWIIVGATAILVLLEKLGALG